MINRRIGKTGLYKVNLQAFEGGMNIFYNRKTRFQSFSDLHLQFWVWSWKQRSRARVHLRNLSGQGVSESAITQSGRQMFKTDIYKTNTYMRQEEKRRGFLDHQYLAHDAPSP